MPSSQTQASEGVTATGTFLGVASDHAHTRFGVVAEAQSVTLVVTHPGTLQTHRVNCTQNDADPLVWEAAIEMDLRGWRYCYDIVRADQLLAGVVDPRAELVRDGMGYIARDTTPVSPRPAFAVRDAVIYELHIRDFTRHATSGVHWEHRGKYPGLAQRGTTLDGGLPTGLDHIVDLGATVVQLMPVHGFDLPYNPQYEWGYMPLFYNAPHDGYAASVELEAPIREFKQLVSALHDAGLRVTLDVVYNHTAEYWPTRLRALMAMAPHTYFRFKDDGTPWDGSACGNEFRSDSLHGRRFIIDSIMHWVTTYKVDGFRFDLMGLIDEQTMQDVTNAVHAVDPTILMYGEPWAAGATPIKVNDKGTQRSKGWAIFNDQTRDALRGHVFEANSVGFLGAGCNTDQLKAGVRASVDWFTDTPQESINYIEAHDNHTLADRIDMALEAAGRNDVTEADRDHIARLGMLALATCQGLVFLHSGQEFGRRKGGYDNTYNLGDDVNNIDWRDKGRNYRKYVYHRNAIAMRLAHPMFRMTVKEHLDDCIRFFDTGLDIEVPDGTVCWRIVDPTGEDSWHSALVMLNGSPERVEVVMPKAASKQVPQADWRICTRDGRFVEGEHPSWQRGTFALRPYSGAVLYHAT